MYKVTKLISFSYGHRLMDYNGKCAHPHGHNGRVEIDLASDVLDHRGMVVDFEDIKRNVKTWIDEKLDHQMILRKDDPLLLWLKQNNEPHFIMDENPTAECLAKLIYHMAKEKGFRVVEVRFWETETSFAAYRE